MFDLEQSIAQWRQQLLAAGIKAPVPLEELEAHLREEIERQIRSGTNAQSAFDAAARQIGQAGELKAEFSKQRRLRDILGTEIKLVSKEWVLKWMPVTHLGLHTVSLLFIAVMVLFKAQGFAELTSSERASSLAAIALSGLFGYAGYFGYKVFPVIPNDWMRAIICGFVLAPVFLGIMTFLSRVNVRLEQLFVDICWVIFVPFGALIGLAWGLERAARKKPGVAGS